MHTRVSCHVHGGDLASHLAEDLYQLFNLVVWEPRFEKMVQRQDYHAMSIKICRTRRIKIRWILTKDPIAIEGSLWAFLACCILTSGLLQARWLLSFESKSTFIWHMTKIVRILQNLLSNVSWLTRLVFPLTRKRHLPSVCMQACRYWQV